MADESAHKATFEGFKEHNNGSRVSTELTLLELVRSSHPDFHVTRTNPLKCDLLGYAADGLAISTKGRDKYYDSSRNYKPPSSRLQDKSGALEDHVLFAQWNYVWNKHNFILYQSEYTNPHTLPTKLFFILFPKSLIVEGGVSPTDQLLLTVGAWSANLHSEIYVFDDSIWYKNKELWESVQGSSWDDVILNADMKASLISDVQGFFDNRPLYKKLAVPWKRGLILHGVPGNGKTISIKALIASLAGRKDPVPSLYVKSFDHCQSEKYSIRNIFKHARTMAPCLLIFEDLDSLVTDKTRSYFLNEVDGLESNDGILMIGSTNHLESLDPAISKRPSRFDRKYHFKLPNEAERVSYADFWRRKLLDNDMVDFPEELCEIVGKLAAGFSFAYMKELFVVTLLTIARGVSPEQDADKVSVLSISNGGESNTIDTPVIVEHEDSMPQESGKQDNTKTADVKVEAQAPKRVIPDIAIPDNLKDNVLLKVIRREMQTLLDEMDSTKEGSWASDKKLVNGGDGQSMMMFGRPFNFFG